MVEVVLGTLNHVALKGCAVVAAGHAQTVEFVDTLVVRNPVGGLGTPEQLHVGRKNRLGKVGVDEGVDGSSVCHVGHTHDTTGIAVHAEFAQQRVLTGSQVGSLLVVGLSNGLGGVGLVVAKGKTLVLSRSSLGSGSLGSAVGWSSLAIGQTAVELLQVGRDFLRGVGLPELEVGATLQEFAHTLGIFHTRHFHHDAAFLAFEHLYVGLYHTKLVDTVGDDVLGICHCLRNFAAENALHLAVAAVGLYFRKLLGSENFCEPMTRGIGLVVFDEQ